MRRRALLGTVTIDGHPEVSADRRSPCDDSPETAVTARDAAGAVVGVVRGGPPLTAVRVGLGAPGFPEVTPAAATPAP